MSGSAGRRARTIHLPEGAGSERIAALLNELKNLDGIIEVKLDGLILTITYLFPDPGFDRIWEIVNRHAGAVSSAWGHKLVASAEQIEREHLLLPCGWDIYVRDIYVASYQQDIERRASQKRKAWQHKKQPENPAT